MTDDALVDELESIGLTEYQSRAYLAAVGLGTTSFTDLADEADIPQQRIYDVVYDLDEIGLLEVHEAGRGKEAVAPPPETALQELKRRRIEEFSSTFDSLVNDLQRQYQDTDASTGGFVTVVSHESSVKRHVSTAVERADWWLFVSVSAEMYEELAEEIDAAVERDVTVRVLVQSGEADAPVDRSAFPEGTLVRRRPAADMLVAADREYGVFRGISAPAVTRPALVTRDKNIVEMLQRYSEQFWAASETVRDRSGFPRRYLTPWQAIVDLERESLDTEPTAYVEGHETDTGRDGAWEGRVVDHELRASSSSDFSVVLPEVARLTLETDDGTITVGGWDATLEDVAAHALELRR